MSNETDELISNLEDAKDYANDAKNNADDSEGMIEAAMRLIDDLQTKIDEPHYCDKCKALIDLKK